MTLELLNYKVLMNWEIFIPGDVQFHYSIPYINLQSTCPPKRLELIIYSSQWPHVLAEFSPGASPLPKELPKYFVSLRGGSSRHCSSAESKPDEAISLFMLCEGLRDVPLANQPLTTTIKTISSPFSLFPHDTLGQ